MNGAPVRSLRARAATSGRLAVTSESRRVQMATRSPSRWSWMRAPSYLNSSALRPPWARRTSPKSPAISASIGKSGTKTRGSVRASAWDPPSRASVATRDKSPRNRAARRTVARSAPTASAMASSTRPSETPLRISPTTMRPRISRSCGLARAASAASRSSRARRAPAPEVAATSANALATSPSVSGGPIGSGGAGGNPRTLSARGSVAGNARPVRKSTAGPTSPDSRARR